jgi:hypothetical protein
MEISTKACFYLQFKFAFTFWWFDRISISLVSLLGKYFSKDFLRRHLPENILDFTPDTVILSHINRRLSSDSLFP